MERLRRVAAGDWENKGQPIRDAIAAGRPFRVGAKQLTFRTGEPGDYLGDLPEPFRSGSMPGVDWVAYSYVTPIAWRLDTGSWVMPDVNYSLTTSQHQGEVRYALDPTILGPTVHLRRGCGTGRGRYGARTGGIDSPYARTQCDVEDPATVMREAYDAMDSAERELSRWKFDASGIPIID